MAVYIDGRKIADQIKSELKAKIDQLKGPGKRSPHLSIIIVGDDAPSHSYVKGKIKACHEVGIEYSSYHFANSISQEKLLRQIRLLNEDEEVDGFIVQLPLPDHIDLDQVINTIDPSKDVDGFTNQNFGSIASKAQKILPATPLGIMELLKRYDIAVQGKHCVVVGSSRLVGAPLGLMLIQNGKSTVTICNKHTKDLSCHTRRADILLVGVGKPKLITKEMIKEGAVIIDAGVNQIADATKRSGVRLVGDVDFENVARVASHITPVPGGVGPMTIASLLMNTLQAYKLKHTDD